MRATFQDEQRVAIDAARTAVNVCRSVAAGMSPDAFEKNDRSPVTVADFASQAAICRALGEAFPDDPVIGEEDSAELRRPENAGFLDQVRLELDQVGVAGDQEQVCQWIDRGGQTEFCDRFWTLDPIDGTKGFLRGGQYAVSLALIVDGSIVLGVLACPNLSTDAQSHQVGSLYYAVRGEGSWSFALEKSSDSARQIHVTPTQSAQDARFCESYESSHSSHGHSAQVAAELGISRRAVRIDSQAKYAIVARGEADIYLRLPTRKDYVEKIWDHAGGVLVVEEAGGRVTDVDGKPLEFHHGQTLAANRGVVVTNGQLHDRVVESVQNVLSGSDG